MLTYAETASSSTIVPGTSVPQSQCQQGSLAALLAHPAFQEGLRCGQENFCDSYEEAPLTEVEMIDEVEGNLSRDVIEARKKCCQMHGWEPDSYLYNLGFVMGTIEQGLRYDTSFFQTGAGGVAMREQRAARTPAAVSTSHTFDLGLHMLEILDGQSVLVVDHGAEREAVQLDQDESYRLLMVLQSVFASKRPA